MGQAMMRDEYTIAITKAMEDAQIEPELGFVVEGDVMRIIASYLPTTALRAVAADQIFTDARGIIRQIPMHPGWKAACDDELVDRMLTETLSDEREELQAETGPEESQGKEVKKKGTPQVYR